MASPTNRPQYEYHLGLLALSFLTRVPVSLPKTVTPSMLSSASRYFALVGGLLGAVLAISFYVFSYFLPNQLAILLMLAFGLLLTGAFHEDGWADVWDGFGGGWTVNDKLNIMKDSRLGTYGAAALVLMLLLKYQSLLALANYKEFNFTVFLAILIVGQSVSRSLATSIIYSLNYVSADTTSKVKPIATSLSFASLFVLLITALLSLVLLALALFFQLGLSVTQVLSFSVLFVIVLFVLRLILMVWFKRQLGGFTGDCLGAAQQLSELMIYLFIVAFFQRIVSV